MIHGEGDSVCEEAMDAALPGLRAVNACYEPKHVFKMEKTHMLKLRNPNLG